MIELFSDKHLIYEMSDPRLLQLKACLEYFKNWKGKVSDGKEFLSDKLWYDLQSMILGFISVVQVKLSKYPGSTIRPAIVNQDLVENHFSQLRGANSQNENPTYLLTQYTQNAVILGQTTISRKGNTGTARNELSASLPMEHPFGRKKSN